MDLTVNKVQKDVSVWRGHTAAHSCTRDLEKVILEERKGIVGEYVVKNETKDGCVGGMRGEVMAVGYHHIFHS